MEPTTVTVETPPPPEPPPPSPEPAAEILRLAEQAGAATQAVEALRAEIAPLIADAQNIKNAIASCEAKVTTLEPRVSLLEAERAAEAEAVAEAEEEMIEPPPPVAPPPPPPEMAPQKPPTLLQRLMF